VCILSWIFLGALAGWITGRVRERNQFSPRMDAIMGVTGGLAGGFLTHYGGFRGRYEVVSNPLSAIFGAAGLTALTAYTNGRKRDG